MHLVYNGITILFNIMREKARKLMEERGWNEKFLATKLCVSVKNISRALVGEDNILLNKMITELETFNNEASKSDGIDYRLDDGDILDQCP